MDVVTPVADADSGARCGVSDKLEGGIVARLVGQYEETVRHKGLRTGNTRGHVVEGHLPDRAIAALGQEVGVALWPHSRELHRRSRYIAIPRVAVLEAHLPIIEAHALTGVEDLGAVQAQMSGEVVDVGARLVVETEGENAG